MAVLTGLVAGGMVFSSFTKSNTIDNPNQINTPINDPTPYWSGYMYGGGNYGHVDISRGYKIKVYQTEGQCNSYYAKNESGEQSWVRENPNFESYSRQLIGADKYFKYMVTFNYRTYYFNM